MRKAMVTAALALTLAGALFGPTLDESMKLYYEGNYKESLISFRTLAQDPNYKDRDLAFYYAGLVSERLQQLADAEVYYQTLLERYPMSSMAEYARIRIEEIKGKKVKPLSGDKKTIAGWHPALPGSGPDKAVTPPTSKRAKVVKVADDDVTIKVQSGESISTLAKLYYGDIDKYRDIAAYNQIKSPYVIYAGQTLVMPGLKNVGTVIEAGTGDQTVTMNRPDRPGEIVIKFPERKSGTEPAAEFVPPPGVPPQVTTAPEMVIDQPPAEFKDPALLKAEIKIDQAQESWDQAVLEYRNEQYLVALRQLKTIIDNYPRSNVAPRARYFRGFIYYALGNLIQAIPEYIATAKLAANDPVADDALYSAAELYYYVLRDQDKAKELYDLLMTMNEDPVLENGFPLKPLIKRRLEEIQQNRTAGVKPDKNSVKPVLTLPSPVFKDSQSPVKKVETQKTAETGKTRKNKPTVKKTDPFEATSVSPAVDPVDAIAREVEANLKKNLEEATAAATGTKPPVKKTGGKTKPAEVTRDPAKSVTAKKATPRVAAPVVAKPTKKPVETAATKPVFTPKPYGTVESFNEIMLLESAADDFEFKTTNPRIDKEEMMLTTPTVSMKKDVSEPDMIIISEPRAPVSPMTTSPATAVQDFTPSKYQSSLHLRLAKAYREQNMINEAIREYEEAMKYDPNNPIIYNNLACMYLDRGGQQNINRAKELVNKGLPLNPSYRGYFYDTLGQAFVKEGDNQQAVFQFKQSLAEQETGARYLHLGTAYLALKLRDEATQAFTRAYEISGGQGVVAEQAKAQLRALK